MDIKYIHVRWNNGADDMVPERSAALLEKAGDLTIIDATPDRYRRFKANVPLGTPAKKTSEPDRKKTVLVNEPAPAGAPDEPEEATK